jgi:hypothetical protein
MTASSFPLRIVSAAVPSAPHREPVHMTTGTVDTDVSDELDLSFDFDLNINAEEYSRIMRRIGIDGDETVTRVSAFNSSI